MEYIDLNYIVKRMAKMLWLAVIVGLVAAGAYGAKTMLSGTNVRELTEKEEHDERYYFDNYQGDYLLYPETSRLIIFQYRFDNDILAQLTQSTIKPVDYSRWVGELMAERLKSGSFSNGFYQRLLDRFPELRADQKAFNILQVEDNMLSYSVDRSSVLWIVVKAPLFLLEDSSNEYTDQQLCAYRDALYDMLAEEMEQTELFSDLSITLHRVSPVTENSVSEQNLVEYYLHEGKSKHTQQTGNTVKKLVLCMFLGMAMVEGVVFLLAVFNGKVKNKEDFSRNTDVEVLDTFRTDEQPDWTLTAVKAAAALESGEGLTVLGEAGEDGWQSGLTAALEQVGCNGKVTLLSTFTPTPEQLHQLADTKLLLTVSQHETSYKTLKALAENLRQVHATVIGAVLVENQAKKQCRSRKS